MTRLELISKIQNLYHRLDENSLETKEIDELVDLTNDLYERTVILRYKVAEQRIFGNSAATIEELEQQELVSEVERKLVTAIDFNIFDETGKLENETKISSNEVEPDESIILDFANEKVKSIDDLEEKKSFEDVKIDQAHENKEQVDVLLSEKKPVDLFEQSEEQQAIEHQIIDQSRQEEKSSETLTSDTEWLPFFEKVIADHGSGIQNKIPALAGSFGLNERILYINELFNGEAEKFSNAVLQLDKTNDWSESKLVMEKLATVQSWEKDSDTTTEFVLHVKKRHG